MQTHELATGTGQQGRKTNTVAVGMASSTGHPQSAVPTFPHNLVQFKDVAVKVKSAETLYKGISFYLEEHPDLLNDLLKVGGWLVVTVGGPAPMLRMACGLQRGMRQCSTPKAYTAPLNTCTHTRRPVQVVEARVDHSRVVDIMRRAGQLPLVKDYLLAVQKNNLLAVSEAWAEASVAATSGAAAKVGKCVNACSACFPVDQPLSGIRLVTCTLAHHVRMLLPPNAFCAYASPPHPQCVAGERGGERAADRGGGLWRAARLHHHLRQLRPAHTGGQVRCRGEGRCALAFPVQCLVKRMMHGGHAPAILIQFTLPPLTSHLETTCPPSLPPGWRSTS